MKRRHPIHWDKVITWIVFVSLVLSIAFVIVMLVLAPTEEEAVTPDSRSKSEYVLMLLQCCLGVVALLLPGLLEHKVNLIIPSRMMIMYALFLYAAIYLGEVRNFYYTVPHWDTILHTFSGGMLGALGFSVVVLLNKADRVPVNLSPAFVALFALCFAVFVGVLWEIYEFTFDGLLGLNMQKFALENGTQLTGRNALADTMEDLIVDMLGAAVIAVIGYISQKYKTGWIDRMLLTSQPREETVEGHETEQVTVR